MEKVYVFLAEGFEEIEALCIVDIMLRAKIEAIMISVMKDKWVKGAHGINVEADELFANVDFNDADILFLPGGMPGKTNLQNNKSLEKLLLDFNKADGRIAAICAAPGIIGRLGILEGKEATCYPGFESELNGAIYVNNKVVTSGNITTGKGMGTAIEMGLELITLLKGKEVADEIGRSIQFYQ